MCNWVTRVTLKHRLITLLVPTVICLIFSIAATSVCKFSQLEVLPYTFKYGLFRAYDQIKDECKSVYDNDIKDWSLTSQYKAAQALAIITILVLTSSIICVSILLCRPFSPCIMKLNNFLLVIGLAANITVGVLMILKSTVKVFDQACSNSIEGLIFRNTPSIVNAPYPSPYTPNYPSPYTPNYPSNAYPTSPIFNPSYPYSFCDGLPQMWEMCPGGRKLASSYDCDFTVIEGGGLNWCTSVLLIITFIMSLIFGCNEVSESDNIEASKMVDNKVYQEEEPEIHLEKEEEPDIFVPAV